MSIRKKRLFSGLIMESRYAEPDLVACFAGTAFWNAEEPLDEIIRRAREVMYAAKAGGKDECLIRKG